MKYMKTFEDFNDSTEANFSQGNTVVCIKNVDDIFKKGIMFKINKIEDGFLHLGEDDIKISLDTAHIIFKITSIQFTKIDRSERL